jgi:ubiquinone/menaquinone biosynthesis C-methylase UbiE
MDASGSSQSNREYYNRFAAGYEKHRGVNDPGGYHELLDELEAEFVQKYGRGGRVLEVGCGTGLVLERLARFAGEAIGIDVSDGMLEKAKSRGLNVRQGSALDLPFETSSFDVTCSFKVLAHIPEITKVLSEMARVTKPGGVVLAEFYNPYSLRGLIKRFGPALKVAPDAREHDVFVRFDSPRAALAMTPDGCELIDARGVRILVPFAAAMRAPGAAQLFRTAERLLCDTPARNVAGFYIAAYRKRA